MASRVMKNEQSHHIITVRSDQGTASFCLVGPRSRQYLSVHLGAGETHTSISGPKTLRALALAILGKQKR